LCSYCGAITSQLIAPKFTYALNSLIALVTRMLFSIMFLAYYFTSIIGMKMTLSNENNIINLLVYRTEGLEI
jgi:hypothetical protein